MGAVGIDKDYSEDHYWWLAYEWRNILIACQACNRSKGPRFPVIGDRADYGTDLESEQALLLDPTDPRDEPSAHLSFSQDGLVNGLTNRGAVTIDVLALNRRSLVESRRLRAKKLLQILKLSTNSQISEHLANELSPDSEYLALALQIIRERSARLGIEIELPKELLSFSI